MQQRIKVRSDEVPGPEMGRELAEEELAGIRGGTDAGGGANPFDLGGITGFSELGGTFGGLGSGLGSLVGNQLNNLMGGSLVTPAIAGTGASSGSPTLNNVPVLGNLGSLIP